MHLAGRSNVVAPPRIHFLSPMLLARLAGLLFLGFIAPSYSQSAPTGVRVTVDEVPRTITGRVTISWTAPVPAPDTYTVTVSPLNYVDTLQDPMNSGFMFSSGDAPSQVSVIGTPPTAGGGVHHPRGLGGGSGAWWRRGP